MNEVVAAFILVGSNLIAVLVTQYFNRKKNAINLDKTRAELDAVRITNIENIVSIYENAIKNVSKQLEQTTEHIKKLEGKIDLLERENKELAQSLNNLNEILKSKS
jgi:predicted RNase H-like nuclease (RuvC/YqgF family)